MYGRLIVANEVANEVLYSASLAPFYSVHHAARRRHATIKQQDEYLRIYCA